MFALSGSCPASGDAGGRSFYIEKHSLFVQDDALVSTIRVQFPLKTVKRNDFWLSGMCLASGGGSSDGNSRLKKRNTFGQGDLSSRRFASNIHFRQ